MPNESALIVGAGPGLSASLARLLEREGFKVALAARNPEKLETKGLALRCDATDAAQVEAAFDAVEGIGACPTSWSITRATAPGAHCRARSAEVEKTFRFRPMRDSWSRTRREAHARRGSGAIFFTGASASVKGYANSAPFAMGKFALRGIAQSMARELAPKGIHIAHFVIDGGIGKDVGDAKLDPDEIARTYLDVYRQHRSAWTWEVELRPWMERF